MSAIRLYGRERRIGIGKSRLAALVVTLGVRWIESILLRLVLLGVTLVGRPIEIARGNGALSVVDHRVVLADETGEFGERIVDRRARRRIGAAGRQRIASAIGTEIVVGHKIRPVRRLRDTG